MVTSTWLLALGLGGTPPVQATGDTCANPLIVHLPAALPFTDFNTTCGRGNDYRDSCLGAYDEGDDIIYQLVLARDMNLRLGLDDAQAVGIAIDAVCPPGTPCLSLETDPGGMPPRLDVQLVAGVYYVQIDTAPPPTCTDFRLTISELPPLQPGDSCSQPRWVRLPSELPFVDEGQTTCGRFDFYSDYESCLGPFTGGQELIYLLDVASTVDVRITLDPKGCGWTAVALDDACPPGGPTCLAFRADDTTQPRIIDCLALEPGLYTLMVDSHPWPISGDCIPAFDLRIEECSLPRGACCVNSSCVGTLTVAQCSALGGAWYEGFDCGHHFVCPLLVGELPEDCYAALAINDLPFAAELYTLTAQANGPPGSCNSPAAPLMQNDVWFRYTAPRDQTLELHTVYHYNGMIVVHTGADCANLQEIDCLDSGFAVPDHDNVSLPATGGTTYWFQVGAYGRNPKGGYTLVVLSADEELLPGDLNCDHRIDFGDINPFVLRLANPAAWQARYPNCPPLNGDINRDGRVDFGDIAPFVNLLAGQPQQPVEKL